MASQAWIEHAYPLQQIVVQLQGRLRSTREDIISQLEEVTRRLKAGDEFGEKHDDDFGYRFEVKAEQMDSFFDTPAGQK
jgi:hypothetical protein